MASVLLTAFEPYDRWSTNASWLTLVQLTRDLSADPKLTTRLYPVDFQAVRRRIQEDLAANYDVVLHLGQAPGSTRVQLEKIGLNFGGGSQQLPDEYEPLVPGGPVAYQSELPLAAWSHKIRAAGIPAQVSFHAGTYLCNGLLYFTHHAIAQRKLKTKAAFVHVPLDPSQSVNQREGFASLPAVLSATALKIILAEIANGNGAV